MCYMDSTFLLYIGIHLISRLRLPSCSNMAIIIGMNVDKSQKCFPKWKQVHVGMEPSKTSLTRWEQHHNIFTLYLGELAIGLATDQITEWLQLDSKKLLHLWSTHGQCWSPHIHRFTARTFPLCVLCYTTWPWLLQSPTYDYSILGWPCNYSAQNQNHQTFKNPFYKI